MNEKNEMKELLLYCIHIAKHKGVFYTEPDFDKAKEYVENMLDIEEIELIQKIALPYEFYEGNETYNKLEKQKELISNG